MPRALDPETSLCVSGEYYQIYHDIVEALSTDTGTRLEIEFLGRSHPLPPDTNVLVDGANIAIPKARLVQAFVVARHVFLRYLGDCPKDKISEVQNATAVILLMDPEHLTAANTRKRLIQCFRDRPEAELEAALRKELLFVDSYLTSRLHRHSKSPNLWGHRRWLLELSASTSIRRSVLEDLQLVVLVAAERHPKNYYTWSHVRWLITTYSTELLSLRDLSHIITVVKDWCLRHPSDTSGFSFLLFGLSYVQCANPDSSNMSNVCSGVCKDVLHLAVSFKWTHESVWVFLRTLAAGYGKEDDRAAFRVAVGDMLKSYPGGQRILENAKDWCVRYAKNSGLDR